MKVRVRVNGEDTTVNYNRPRTGGTLLMSSRFHKDKRAYDRKRKHKNKETD